MKKRVIWIGLLLLALAAFVLQKYSSKNNQIKPSSIEQSQTSKEKPVKIVTATDLHYLSSKLTDNGEFFTDLIDNADGKNMYYIEEIADAFVDQMLAEKPEILILSGDITFNGEKQSHLDLVEKLEKIRKNGTQILVIPGNHDVERSSAAKFVKDGYEIVDTISKDAFAELYQEYGLQQALHRDKDSLSYVYKAREDLWILMLDSNSNKDNTVSDETIEWMETVLEEAEKEKTQVLAVSHQNILIHNGRFTNGFLVDQATKITHLYEKYGVLLNLSGHIHIQHIKDGKTPEIITSALSVSPHHYAQMSYNGQEISYQTQDLKVDAWAKKQGIIDEKLSNFSKSSHQFMLDVAKRKFEEQMISGKLTQAERRLLMDTAAELNADYFAGHKIDKARYQKGIDLWKNQDSQFFKSYLTTILESGQQEHQYFLKKALAK